MKLKSDKFLFLYLFCLFSCSTERNFVKYVKDYVEVGKILPSDQLPYIVKLHKGNKHLLAVGVAHTYDIDNPQIKAIKEIFSEFDPDVTLNEGGQITKKFQDEKEAVALGGEVGLLKYLSDLSGKILVNGDTEDSLEYPAMLKKYPEDDLLLYYVMERLIIPYLNGAYSNREIDELYEIVIQKWFIKEGFPVDENLKNFSGYKYLYKSKIGHDLVLAINPDIELFDYVNPNCKYCQIGRDSKVLRDAHLLEKIHAELQTHDKVMVVFGHGHILAVEPALKKMIDSFD